MSSSSSSIRRRVTPTLESITGDIVFKVKGSPTIGRSEDNEIYIPDKRKHISRKHAALIKQNGSYAIRDLGSKNGTYVNKEKISDIPVVIKEGDIVHLGLYRFIYHEAHYKKQE